MRKLSGTILAAAAVLTGTLAQTAGPAYASPAAPAVDVLTYGATGPAGPNIPIGNTLAASLPALAAATFQTSGLVGTTCSSSTIKSTVVANPPAPGVATSQIGGWVFGSCTSNVPGVTGVIGVVVNNLPNSIQFSDAPGLPLQIVPAPAGPLEIAITENTATGPIVCTWQPAAGVYKGNYLNGGNQIVLKQQQMQLITGPAGLCAGPIQFFSVDYQPLLDTSIAGAPPVFVN